MEDYDGEITESLVESGTGYSLMVADGGSSWAPSPSVMGYRRALASVAYAIGSFVGAMIGAAMSGGTANGTQQNVEGQLASGQSGGTAGYQQEGGKGTVQRSGTATTARPVPLTAVSSPVPPINGSNGGNGPKPLAAISIPVPDAITGDNSFTVPAQGVVGPGGQKIPAASDSPLGRFNQALQGFSDEVQALKDHWGELSQEEKDVVLDVIGGVFDIAGIFDPTPTSDGIGTLFALYRGDYWGALFSAVSIIPYVGDLVGKIPKFKKLLATMSNLCELSKKNKKLADAIRPMLEKANKILDTAIENLPSSVGDELKKIKSKIEEILNGCFALGTPLLVPGGHKRIEDIQPGDMVLALPEDHDDAVPVPRMVEEVYENYLPVMTLRIGRVEIRTTIEHPFWVEGRGWTPANLMVEGDRFRSHDGSTVVLTGIEYSTEISKVYNLRIADYHTFFVGDASWGFSVWTHNDKPCTPPGGADAPNKTAKAQALADIEEDAIRTGQPVPGIHEPDPYAGDGISTSAGSSVRGKKVTTQNNINGNANGCHICGSRSPGTPNGNWVKDHIPSTHLAKPGDPQMIYPSCLDCSNRQGWLVRNLKALQNWLSIFGD